MNAYHPVESIVRDSAGWIAGSLDIASVAVGFDTVQGQVTSGEFGLTGTMLAIVGLLGLTMGHEPRETLSQLAENVERLADGEYDLAFPTDRDDDIGQLSEALDGLAAQLREREHEAEQYRKYTNDVLDALDDVFYVLDEDGTVQRWNESLASVTGYSDDEIAEMHALEFFPEDERERIAGAIGDVYETGERHVESALLTRDGDRIPYEFLATRLEDQGGNVVLTGIGRDISEWREHERKLRERERELSTLMDNIPGMVYRAGNERSWPFEFVSEGCREVTGYEPEALENGEVNWGEDVVAEDNDELWEAVQRAIDANEPYRMTFQITDASGDRRWVWEQGRGVFDDDGELVALEGVILDITARKETEQELERTSDILEKSQRLANVGGWEVDLRSESPSHSKWTDEFANILDHPIDSSLTIEEGSKFFHPEDRQRVRETVEKTIETGEPYEIEARIIRSDGTERWVRSMGELVHRDGNPYLQGALQDITDQKTRERELERTTDLLEQTQRIANVGGWEVDLEDGPPYPGTFTDELYRIHELPSDTDVTMGDGLEFYHPADRDVVRDAVEHAIEQGERYEIEARLVTAEDNERWVRTSGIPVYEDGEIVRLRGALQDITEQKERELALESLQETARGLLGTETATEVAEFVVERTGFLDVPGVAIYLLDDETNTLEPIACSDEFADLCGDPQSVSIDRGDSILWDAFVGGEEMVVDGEDATDSYVFSQGVERGLVVPMNDYGVFVVASPETAIDDETQRLLETLIATTEAALDRLESETLLRERESELATRNQRLRRQIQINNIIRSTHTSLIGADSREEIERTVCERLVEAEHIDFAWIGAFDTTDDEMELRAWDGTGQDYLDDLSLAVEEGAEPAVVTARTGESTVVSNVVEGFGTEDWRQRALLRDFHSVVSVPLSFDEFSVGVLTVYADEPDAFSDLEQTVFTELGESIANAIIAVNTRHALHADMLVELTMQLESDSFFARLAQDAGCQVQYEGLASQSGDESRLFFTTSGADAGAVLAALDDLVSVTSARLVSESDEGCLFEVTVTEETVPTRLARHGGRLQSIRVVDSALEIVVEVPTTTNVREFVEMLEEEYTAVELLSRRNVERSIQTRQEFLDYLLEALTDRQQEVLKTAYYAGFFEWPRASTGEEIAEMLGVTQPTVNRHLRLSQQQLLEALFEHAVVERDG